MPPKPQQKPQPAKRVSGTARRAEVIAEVQAAVDAMVCRFSFRSVATRHVSFIHPCTHVLDSQDLHAEMDKFAALPISEETKTGLRTAGFTKLTSIQRSSIPRALKGRDVRWRWFFFTVFFFFNKMLMIARRCLGLR